MLKTNLFFFFFFFFCWVRLLTHLCQSRPCTAQCIMLPGASGLRYQFWRSPLTVNGTLMWGTSLREGGYFSLFCMEISKQDLSHFCKMCLSIKARSWATVWCVLDSLLGHFLNLFRKHTKKYIPNYFKTNFYPKQHLTTLNASTGICA